MCAFKILPQASNPFHHTLADAAHDPGNHTVCVAAEIDPATGPTGHEFKIFGGTPN
jgi:hypothetical protein